MGITFDQYQRYKTIQIIVEAVKKYYNIDKLNILEVGSNEQLNLEKFLPNENITYSDLTIPKKIDSKVKFIEADATSLKNINDGEFDIVISSDVFEHISKDKRIKFLNETSRVAKLLNLNCFPFKSEAVESAEIRANEYYKAIFGQNHIWLSEHIDNGLPNIDEVKNILENMNRNYLMFEHGDILLWEQMTKSTFYSYTTPELISFQDRIDDFYKKNIFIHDSGENNYRKFIVITNDLKLNNYLDNNVKNLFSENLSQKYIDFIHKNIQDMRSIAQLPMKKEKLEKNEKTTLYLDTGNGFNEESKISYSYKVNKSSGNIDLLINIPTNVKNIRFDPIEGKTVVLSGMNIVSNIGTLNYEIFNGYCIDNYIVFDNDDPQIMINCSEKPIQWLKIQANISTFDYSSSIGILNKLRLINEENENSIMVKDTVLEKENIIKELSDNLTQKENNIKELKNELEYYKLHYHTAILQREEFKNRLQHIENSYNQILNSTCWKITKPIRIILDLMKKILKSNKYTHLTCKGIKCLKQNGIKYTLRKITQKSINFEGYNEYVKQTILTDEEKQIQINTKFSEDIKFSIVVPLYNTPKNFLCEMINSCINQTYGNWELCLADGSDKEHSYVSKVVEDYIKKDKRIKYKILEANRGISENTNECIKMAIGEYIALFDHDDVLHQSALFEYMKVICEKNADFIYCDEDKFDTDVNMRFDPHFKPDFSIDNLRANNYICHFTVFKKTLIQETGLFRKEFDGSQDHDMILRLTEKSKNIVHIPKILYHWRVSSNSVASDPYAKPYTIEAGINAVKEHLSRCDLKATVESSTVHPNIYRIKYSIIDNQLISILIPNKDHIIDLSRCINSILEKSTYKNIEIIIIENNRTERKTFEYYKTLEKYKNIKVVTYESKGKFNYSAINNFGVRYAKGNQLLFLNNDIEIISENWLEEMLMYSQREDVGAIGAKLYYPNDTIQHAGLGLGILTLAGHYFRHFNRDATGYMGNLFFTRNVSGVTAACIMMKKSIFNEINGFDETFEVAFNDVDLCMRIRKAGYLIVWTPYAEAYHYESISRGTEDTPERKARFNGEVRRFQERWKKELKDGDHYYNVNLTLDREDFSLR
ncbi:glycosyltransferase [Clostridium botulinum]|nr:glycosyltransferase [Clostridium botulinum]